MARPVFFSSFFEQRRSLEILLKESKASGSFYILLSLSTFITTLGFMVNSGVVIVGGMFVAPLLYPILSLGMGISTSSREAIFRSFKIIFKSIIFVFFISFITSFVLTIGETTEQMIFASNPNLLFFLIAFASGVVASYSWVKEKISSTLPGIAMAIALLPPLALSGVAASLFSRELFTGSLTLFLINLLGIVVASTIVFSLFGFSRLQQYEEEKIEEEKLEEKVQKLAKEEGARESELKPEIDVTTGLPKA